MGRKAIKKWDLGRGSGWSGDFFLVCLVASLVEVSWEFCGDACRRFVVLIPGDKIPLLSRFMLSEYGFARI